MTDDVAVGVEVDVARLAVVQTAAQLRQLLAEVEPGVLSGASCLELADVLARTEKTCAAARVRVSARVADCGAHRARGFARAEDWAAGLTGSSGGVARDELALAGKLERCLQTDAALRAGELSLAQAMEVARTACAGPGSEAEMLGLAQSGDLVRLRDEGRRRRLAALEPGDAYRRQRRERSFRSWTDSAGMIRFRGALTPDTGVPFLSRLDAVCDRIRRQAKAGALPDAEIELREAHAADAFVSLLGDGDAGELPTASAQPKPGRAVELVLVWDLAAAMRGHTHPGEMCSILGAGPTSDEVVRRLSVGAFVKVVTHDGVKIDTVTHVGRHLPAELRTALHLGAPPTFDGVSCREHGCGRRYGLEWDHVDPVANGGPTSQENLQPLCWDHHQDKTERDRRAGRLGRFPPGNLDFDARAGAGAPP